MSYTKPTPADLKLRYTAFAAVDNAVVQYWLTDAERGVDTSWIEGDYAPALMALAAYNMSVEGLGAKTQASAIPAGVTRFRSASMDVAISESVANQASAGGYQANRYGQEYERMLRRSKGGPRLVA